MTFRVTVTADLAFDFSKGWSTQHGEDAYDGVWMTFVGTLGPGKRRELGNGPISRIENVRFVSFLKAIPALDAFWRIRTLFCKVAG